jgi:hypothetical protein
MEISEGDPSATAFLLAAFATVALLALTEHYVDLLAALVAFTAGGFVLTAGNIDTAGSDA